MTLNQKDPMFLEREFIYKLTPQLIKFNISINGSIPLPASGGTGVFFSCIVNPFINV